eukprot:scaffold32393_cov69-Phaeocystis_antarctica.AAC.5
MPRRRSVFARHRVWPGRTPVVRQCSPLEVPTRRAGGTPKRRTQQRRSARLSRPMGSDGAS